MKLHFTKQDSLYTIFKTVKKVPAYKSVSLFIDPHHIFFENERRGKQLKELIEQQELDTICIATNQHMQAYYQQLGLTTQFQYTRFWQKRKKLFMDFIFKSKKTHQHLIFKNNYLSYLIVISEVLVIGAVLYFFWGLISPNATLIVEPARQIEHIVYNYQYYPGNQTFLPSTLGDRIAIPYFTGYVPFEHRMTINVQNIAYTIENAQGTVIITNTLDETFSLLDKTKLISPEGLLFELDESITIPAASTDGPGTIRVGVTALPYTESGEHIGSLGNIAKGTQLLIKNLPESNVTRQIIAVADRAFANGETISTGTVLAEDITLIEQRIVEYMQDKMKEKLQEETIDDDLYVLPFDEFIQLHIGEFITTSHVGDTTSFIEGKVKARISYRYVYRSDILSAVDTYLLQRPSERYALLDYDTHSLRMYNIHQQKDEGVYIIPTQLNIIRGYNFSDDLNELVPEMKAKISSMQKDQAEKVLLGYDEIQGITISISPPWYDTLPQMSSRIKFRVQ